MALGWSEPCDTITYDAKWFLLPDRITLIFIILGLLYAGSHIVFGSVPFDMLLSLAGSLVILSGLYLVLYVISRGKWIGFGDIKLGVGLALFVIDWRLRSEEHTSELQSH